MKKILFILSITTPFIHAHDATYFLEESKKALEQKKTSDALALIKRAQSLDPENADVLSQLAMTYFFMVNYTPSLELYKKCLATNPTKMSYVYNIAITLIKMGRFEESVPYLEQVYVVAPLDQIKTHLFKNYLRAQQWKKFEALFTTNLWWYNENIYGKTILLELDKEGNGDGDVFQFLRYAQKLNQAGAHVTIQVRKSLIPLCSLLPYVDRVITTDEEITDAYKTYSICIASLMSRMRQKATIPSNDAPYLFADHKLIDLWKQKLSTDNKVKIGLCWQSRIVRDAIGQRMPSPRTIPIQALEPLLSTSNCSFYSLHRETDLYEPILKNIIQFSNNFDEKHGSFMDTAALMKNLDVVITIDTSIAHLAGGLGVPVYLLLSCESDYRWFLHQDYSPWYPTMKIFRQKNVSTWDDVIQDVLRSLEQIRP